MNIDLHFAPHTRSTRPRFLLEELGVSYNLIMIDMKAGDHKKDAHVRVHPHGSVPAMAVDGIPMIESAAMVAFLADAFPDKKMAPAATSPERVSYMQWLFYAVATAEPALIAALNEKATDAEIALWHKVQDVIAAGIGNKDHLLSTFSAADVLMGSVLVWASAMKKVEHPTLLAYCERIKARPAFVTARK
jgi:glutathione S-transferase